MNRKRTEKRKNNKEIKKYGFRPHMNTGKRGKWDREWRQRRGERERRKERKGKGREWEQE